MLKNKIELIRDGKPQCLLEWHRPDGQGGHIPIAMEFADDLEPEMVERITTICGRPVSTSESKSFPGSSAHFLALPKLMERLGFRVRMF